MAYRYDLTQDYSFKGDKDISYSGYWVIAIFRLGRPLSYSRKIKGSVGNVIDGVLLRKEKPLIITKECIQLSINSNKRSYLQQLSATLKDSENYLSADMVLTGDWMFAWITTNSADQENPSIYGDKMRLMILIRV